MTSYKVNALSTCYASLMPQSLLFTLPVMFVSPLLLSLTLMAYSLEGSTQFSSATPFPSIPHKFFRYPLPSSVTYWGNPTRSPIVGFHSCPPVPHSRGQPPWVLAKLSNHPTDPPGNGDPSQVTQGITLPLKPQLSPGASVTQVLAQCSQRLFTNPRGP